MSTNEIRQSIIGAAYRACLDYELRNREFEVQEEKPIPVVYNDEVRLVDGVHRIVNNYQEET